MAIIKSDPIEGVLANITVYEYTNNGVVVMRELYAHEGYAMYDKTQDTGLDENGNPLPPTYHYMACLPPSVPITDFEAVLIEEGMEVVGKPDNPDTEIM